MARKTFIIDTNVLLHDPDAISKFQGNNVVIPMMVLEELDGLKRLSDELGKNARHVLRYIDSLKQLKKGNLHTGVELENGITVRIYIDMKTVDKTPFPLPLDRNVNKILLVAYRLKEMGEDVVVVVSKDFLLRVKAESIGIEAQDYENLKFSYEHIYRGFRRLDVPKRDIDLFYKDGFLPID
ncbi:MAG: PIN domain-containing protein, partial [Chlamydiota bacterium]